LVILDEAPPRWIWKPEREYAQAWPPVKGENLPHRGPQAFHGHHADQNSSFPREDSRRGTHSRLYTEFPEYKELVDRQFVAGKAYEAHYSSGWIWKGLEAEKGVIVLLLCLSLLSSLVAVSFPLLTKSLLDLLERAAGSSEKEGLKSALSKAVLYFSALGFAALIVGFFPGVRGAINNIFDYLIRKRYFSLVAEKDYRFFSAFSSPDIVTRLSSDINDFPKLAWFLCSGIFRAVESGSKIIFCAVAMALLDRRLALFSFLSLPLMLLIFSKVQSNIYDKVKQNEEAISSVNEQLELSFSGVRILKSFASEAKYDRFFDDVLEKRYETEMGVASLRPSSTCSIRISITRPRSP
jgi:ABC-type multidrug transport system fused ATPase/permease subunit